MTDDAPVTLADVQAKVDELLDLKDELIECDEMLRARYPDMFERMDELAKQMPGLQAEIKDLTRQLGKGTHDFGRTTILVKKASVKQVVDLEGIIERAEERGETQALLDAEVLKYSVNSHQIERLEGTMKAVYRGYISEKVGTSGVVMPPELK